MGIFVGGIVTGAVGIITFKIYERYRNRKDNNLLYIEVIKLKREITRNLNEVQDDITKYNRMLELKEVLRDDYQIIKRISTLQEYMEEVPIFETNGEQVGLDYEYSIRKYAHCNEIRSEISLRRNKGESERYIAKLEEDLKVEEEKTLPEELISLYAELEHYESSESLADSFDYIKDMSAKYNAYEDKEKSSRIIEFCNELLGKGSKCRLLIDKFKEHNNLDRQYSRGNKRRKIKFEEWFNLNIDLLAVYDSAAFLKCDDAYNDNKMMSYHLDDIKDITWAFNIINEEVYPPVLELESKLNTILKKTNQQFKDI